MAVDKNGKTLEVGQRVKVESAGAAPWGNNPSGSYEGVVSDLHEDGAFLTRGDGERTAPLAAECEILDDEATDEADESTELDSEPDKPKRATRKR